MKENNGNELWINTNYTHRATKMHPVMSVANKVVYWVSEDKRTLCFDVGDAFGGRRRPIRYYSAQERTEMIHDYLENHLPPFCDKVDTLILKMGRFGKEEHFVLDDERLLKYFPKLGIVCCNDAIDLTHGEENVYMLDAFDLGEMSLNLARDGDFEMANHFTRELWALDHTWAKFFREVAVDFQLPRDEHLKHYPDLNVANTGLDKLFRIYLLGWYSSNGDLSYDNIVCVENHQSLDRAMDLLEDRFKNWEFQEVIAKLSADLKHVELHQTHFQDLGEESDGRPDYSDFLRVVIATDRLYPGTIDKLYADGTISCLLD
jgi:hypothetical protein